MEKAGTSHAHHGEIVQGVFSGNDGQLHRGLVTLPYPRLRSQAQFSPTLGSAVVVHPPHKSKAATGARLALAKLGAPPGGMLTIESDIAEGHGYGSSTADVVASIRAVAVAYEVAFRTSTECLLAVSAERASDAVAFEDHAVLFAQREGKVIEDFGGHLPPLRVVGFKANGGRPVDTLALEPAHYTSEEIQQFAVLRGLVARSVRFQDPRLLGQAATVSATISQRRLPKLGFKAALALAREGRACGIQVAHSGSLIGILFDGLGRESAAVADATDAEARRLGFIDVETFCVGLEVPL